MNRFHITAGALVVVAGMAAASLLWGNDDAPPEPENSAPPTPTATSVEEIAPAAGQVGTLESATEPEKEDSSHLLELPDGTSVPALNGAVGAAPLADYWGRRPYSPIIGVKSAKGVDWYEHANGSFSTTQMVWREDLGRHAAMTRVGHPGSTPPDIAR